VHVDPLTDRDHGLADQLGAGIGGQDRSTERQDRGGHDHAGDEPRSKPSDSSGDAARTRD